MIKNVFMSVIELENITMEYESHKPILHDISMKLDSGSFHFLVGKSGAGKSSLLKLMALMRSANKGLIRLFGKNVQSLKRNQLSIMRRKIGFVGQDADFFEHLTVAENVALPLVIGNMPAKQIREYTMEMLDWIGISKYADSYPNSLSGGEKQRIAIARAVIDQPDLLLADEPTGSLDSELGYRVMQLFATLNKAGSTILVATHDEAMIRRFNFPEIRLHEGKLRQM